MAQEPHPAEDAGRTHRPAQPPQGTGSVPHRRKRKPRIQRRTLPGAPPGTLQVDPHSPQPVISVIAYGPDQCVEGDIKQVADLRAFLGRHPVCWINVRGLGDANVLLELADLFGLHQLALEDVVNTHQRPKLERYATHHFIVTRALTLNAHLETEQISIFQGEDFVLSFQERLPDTLESVGRRIREGGGRIRRSPSCYLAYAIMDTVLDSYFPVLERYGERLEDYEDRILLRNDHRSVHAIHGIKRDLLTFRRALWPLREVGNSLIREESPLIAAETRVYLRDLTDHVTQLMDLVEMDRELCADLRDMHLTSVSNRMNEIMKVLTVIATIFIPLSFITGLYGMNFDTAASPFNMPELHWYLGYPFALGIMGLVAAGLVIYFWRKGWVWAQGASLPQPTPAHDHPRPANSDRTTPAA